MRDTQIRGFGWRDLTEERLLFDRAVAGGVSAGGEPLASPFTRSMPASVLTFGDAVTLQDLFRNNWEEVYFFF